MSGPLPSGRASDYEKLALCGNKCRDRFCLPCQKERAALIANHLISLLEGEPARFITLTLAHRNEPLKDTLDRLYKDYAKLRRTGLWMRTVRAAAATLEITYNRDRGEWHPHLHILARGRYVPHADLKAAWHKITGDSFIVDIRYVKDQSRAAQYVAKYAAKAQNGTYSTHPAALEEALAALKGRRMVMLTGEWYGMKLPERDHDGSMIFVANLDVLLSRAIRGDPDARDILARVAPGDRKCPIPSSQSP